MSVGVNARGISLSLGAFQTLGKRFKRACKRPLYKQIKGVSVFRVRMQCQGWGTSMSQGLSCTPCRGAGHTESCLQKLEKCVDTSHRQGADHSWTPTPLPAFGSLQCLQEMKRA